MVRQLEYKCDWYGRTLIKIDRWFPISKRCFECGHIVEKMPLKIREWDCPKCGAHHDRNINAAKNINADRKRSLYLRLSAAPQILPSHRFGDWVPSGFWKIKARLSEPMMGRTVSTSIPSHSSRLWKISRFPCATTWHQRSRRSSPNLCALIWLVSTSNNWLLRRSERELADATIVAKSN